MRTEVDALRGKVTSCEERIQSQANWQKQQQGLPERLAKLEMEVAGLRSKAAVVSKPTPVVAPHTAAPLGSNTERTTKESHLPEEGASSSSRAPTVAAAPLAVSESEAARRKSLPVKPMPVNVPHAQGRPSGPAQVKPAPMVKPLTGVMGGPAKAAHEGGAPPVKPIMVKAITPLVAKSPPSPKGPPTQFLAVESAAVSRPPEAPEPFLPPARDPRPEEREPAARGEKNSAVATSGESTSAPVHRVPAAEDAGGGPHDKPSSSPVPQAHAKEQPAEVKVPAKAPPVALQEDLSPTTAPVTTPKAPPLQFLKPESESGR